MLAFPSSPKNLATEFPKSAWSFALSTATQQSSARTKRWRLNGVDTPETVHPKRAVQCFGKDAKEFTLRMVESKSIRLVLDESNAARNHKDRYNRPLGLRLF
jgi:endonuclease YncB( thermonuclease family)